MDAMLKAKWVKALRSGEYKQGRGRLIYEDRYCCLGVLCEIADRPHDLWELEVDFGGSLQGWREDFGLSQEQEHILIRMNDGKRDIQSPQDFNAIADYIEKHL